jgi:hypothetical protein
VRKGVHRKEQHAPVAGTCIIGNITSRRQFVKRIDLAVVLLFEVQPLPIWRAGSWGATVKLIALDLRRPSTPKAFHSQSPGFGGLFAAEPWDRYVIHRANPERVALGGQQHERALAKINPEVDLPSGTLTEFGNRRFDHPGFRSKRPRTLGLDSETPSA